MTQTIKMYKAIDFADNTECLFAVRGQEMVIRYFGSSLGDWGCSEEFNFDDYFADELDESRMSDRELLWESNMNNLVANNPAPAMQPYPLTISKKQVNIEDVLQVLRNEGASSEMIIAVKELTIPC